MLASLACAPRRLACRYWALFGPGGAPSQLVLGVRPARAGCRAVRESTLVAWYRFLYAPRTGGAYDSHHRTAGTAGRTRRRGGRVAAHGARAAVGDAGDRISQRHSYVEPRSRTGVGLDAVIHRNTSDQDFRREP